MKPSHFAYVLLLVCSSAAACDLPALVAIPERAGDDVGDVLRAVRRYSDAIVAYAGCVKTELEAAGGDAAPAFQRAALIARNNHAVAEAEAVMNLYATHIGPTENLRLAEYLEAASKDCVFSSSIVRTGVVNDGAVIFFGRNEQAYLSILEQACPGLERQGEFVVGPERPTTGITNEQRLERRICDQDRVYPFREGDTRKIFGCNLGRLYPIAEAQALQILTTLGPSTAAGDAAR
ncbi:MAG TPA: hypothetical protein VE907_14415 [Gammaproteobacteria bacterium]|nr:hypothetical protein [Gammaproteobacteria bacterium]